MHLNKLVQRTRRLTAINRRRSPRLFRLTRRQARRALRRYSSSMDVLHLGGSVRLSQFLRPPVARERPSGRRFEVTPPIDRQDNLGKSGGRQVRPLAGQLLN
jgi:hypothetical protein